MKLQFLALWSLLLLCAIPSFSQQIKGQIIDSKTGEPVAFATIQFADNNGVVSNMEGFFALTSEELNPESVLTISFMGYQTKNMSMKEFQAGNNLIKLNEAVNQLDTVYITNKLPSVDSIMARVNRNLVKNYQYSNVKQTLFTRETAYFKANDLTVDIEKSSGFNKKQLEASNKQFKELTNQIVNNPPTRSFTDVLLDLYLKSDTENKMEVKQATRLLDHKNTLSIETLQAKVSKIVLQHLDTTKTYKVKTGWFKIEDSLSFKKSKEVKNDSINSSFYALKSNSVNGMKEHLFGKDSKFDFVLDTKSYNYDLTNVTTIDDQLVYIINFEPRKSRAKFKGTIYVADEDYAILKMDYGFADGKVGEKLNLKLLLGVKYIESLHKGTVIYKKNTETATYFPFYINQESGKYMYAHRPFKFIENSDSQKNKVGFDLKIEGTIVEKYEVMSLDYTSMDLAAYNNIKEGKKVEFIPLKQYDPSIWSDYTIIEPLEELKKFKVEE